MFAAAAAAQTTRAKPRTITVLDDLSSWGTTGALSSSPPAPVYIPAGLTSVYPPPAPTQWGFSHVRGMRFTGSGSQQLAHTYTTPLDFTGCNILLLLRTTDPRSTAGSWQSGWHVQFSSDGGASTLAEYTVQASSADFPVNKPGEWFPIELPTTNMIPAGTNHSTISRLGILTGKTAPDFSRINLIRMTASSLATNGAGDPGQWDVYLGGIGKVSRPATGVITFCCDRFHADNFNYYVPVLERSLPEYGGDGHYRGWKATFRGNPKDIDSGPTLMTTAMLRAMQNEKGHRLGIYSGDYGGRIAGVFPSGENNFGDDPATTYPVPWSLLTTPSQDTIANGLQGSKDTMLALGLVSQRDLVVGQERKLYGDAYHQIIEGMFAYSDMPNSEDHPHWWPSLNPYHRPTRMHLAVADEASGGQKFRDFIHRVWEEKQHGRLLFHNIDVDTSVGAGFVATPTQLESICQYIESLGLPVRTEDDVIAGRV